MGISGFPKHPINPFDDCKRITVWFAYISFSQLKYLIICCGYMVIMQTKIVFNVCVSHFLQTHFLENDFFLLEN